MFQLQPSVLELALLGGWNWAAGSGSKGVLFDLCLVNSLRISPNLLLLWGPVYVPIILHLLMKPENESCSCLTLSWNKGPYGLKSFFWFLFLFGAGSCCIDQAGLEHVGDHPASAFLVLGVQMCTDVSSPVGFGVLEGWVR